MQKKFLAVFLCFIFSIIVFLAFILLGTISFRNPGLDLLPIEYVIWFLPLLPGSMYSDIFFFYLFPILSFIIFFAIAPFLIQFLFKVNKISFTLRKKPKYGFLILEKDIKPSRIVYRTLILSLFTFSTAILIMQILDVPPQSFRMILDYHPELKPLYIAEATFFLTFFLTSFCSLLFLPIWLLEDCGLMLYREFPEQRRTPVVEGVYYSYFKFLETYTGIATVIAYIRQIFVTMQVIINSPMLFDPGILTPLIVLFLPFIVTGLFAIPLYLYERFLPKSLKRVYEKFSKYELPHISLPEFNDLTNNSSK